MGRSEDKEQARRTANRRQSPFVAALADARSPPIPCRWPSRSAVAPPRKVGHDAGTLATGSVVLRTAWLSHAERLFTNRSADTGRSLRDRFTLLHRENLPNLRGRLRSRSDRPLIFGVPAHARSQMFEPER